MVVTVTPVRSAASNTDDSTRRPSVASRWTAPVGSAGIVDAREQPACRGQPLEITRAHHLDTIPLGQAGDQLAAGALGDETTVVDDADARADSLGLLHVVGGVEDGHAVLAELAHLLEDGVAALWVDADGRLVEHEEGRTMEEAAGDVESPLHATGERLDPLVGPVGQVDDVEGFDHPLGEHASAQLVEPSDEAQVLGRGQVGVERDLLGHEAHPRPHRRRRSPRLGAVDADGAVVGRQQPADHPDRRRLARAVGPEQSVRLTGGDVEGDIVHRQPLAEPSGQVRAAQHRSDCHEPTVAGPPG